MKRLLTLPPNLVSCFHEVTGLDNKQWFCNSDPRDHKIGSGGGTANLLKTCHDAEAPETDFNEWLASEKRIILHAGGQSRRLPAYAPCGKVLTPVPVFRWERGQKLSQNLLSLQVPLYEHIMKAAPKGLHTLVASGDVYIRADEDLQPIPDVDVVCYGLWLEAETACNHGVFIVPRQAQGKLEYMLQKPSRKTLKDLEQDYFYLTDIGVWLLSDKAVNVLMKRSMKDGKPCYYDLYGEFGCSLGEKPSKKDDEVSKLTTAVIPLAGGEFYHFGTTRDMINSTLAIQNIVSDQRQIIHHSSKPNPAIFTQNATTLLKITNDNDNVWIENSYVSSSWTISHDNVITGVPRNFWQLNLRAGNCIDMVPMSEDSWAVRTYGFDDTFRGRLCDADTMFIGRPFTEWAAERGISPSAIPGKDDIQTAEIFAIVNDIDTAGDIARWMLNEPNNSAGAEAWRTARKVSAEYISANANLTRLEAQRRSMRKVAWPVIARNYRHSVFYQLDLHDAAKEFAEQGVRMPEPLPQNEALMTRISDAMFRAEVMRDSGKSASRYDGNAFALLREGITEGVKLSLPELSVCNDQIVWARSPVRIDIAGGWTDTPPYCLIEGGKVVNFAVKLNGQPPLQAYVKPCKDPVVILRSIDMGATEMVETYEELADFKKVGSPFSISKAALALAGFLPDYCAEHFSSLKAQLKKFGCGIELTSLSAVPAGSGLGTSSILSATVLGALNDFCGLRWDRSEIGFRTLVLEQILTTGGGWQDQFGGVLNGVKLLETENGFNQTPTTRWLPEDLWTRPEYSSCHLLYYTGLTRTAKKILTEIVRDMFLNRHEQLALLREMKHHAVKMFDAIQRADFNAMGRLVRETWDQNKALDSGTNPPDIERLTSLIDDYCLGYKLPGAGGGGYLYMIAKDPEAAALIKSTLNANRINRNARFVDMSLCHDGLQTSRS